MVDTAITVDGNRQALAGGFSASVQPAADALAAYRRFAEANVAAPAQSALWVDVWSRQAEAEPFIVTVERGGSPALMVAMQTRARGPFRVAEWLGSSHANGNFAPCVAGPDARLMLDAIMQAVRMGRRDIDLIALERQLHSLDGMDNAFSAAALKCVSPNVALAVDLAGGFDAVLERTSRKRKLKKHRSQLRKFESAGGFRQYEASDPTEVEHALNAFFDMRAARFRAQGIQDVFAPARVRHALRQLYQESLQAAPHPFALHVLEVGGTIRAVTGSARSGNRVICDFIAYRDDELAQASPGDFLIFENIRAACEEGFAIFDFSVGDETYKRAWCNLETHHFDAFLPLTVKGRALALAEIGLAGAKRRIKENRTLWSLARNMRALRGRNVAPEKD